ncbi:MAG TPA: SAM-dependent chlorinase/fluorinase [Bacteroidia bacterium]|jgi:S-adenosylmethionine hydrolase|nr:SAM-dependent chlorinase/fluorinase [Bacteroidia bacterium]
MPIITLTSDFGLKDHFVSTVKGAIYSEIPDITLTDISHLIPPCDILQGAYIFSNAWKYFPAGTIHIIAVNAVSTIEHPHVGIFHQGHYFVGNDNGLFSLVFPTGAELIVELNLRQDNDAMTFPTRDVFVKAACHLARGGTLEMLGKRKEQLIQRNRLHQPPDDYSIKGNIIYIDSVGNLVTDITQKQFRETGQGRNFTIEIAGYNIDKIVGKYSEVADGEMLALFNSSGYLEIGQNKGSAVKALKKTMNETIRIEFHANKDR